jgi:hypothetical protein
MRAADQDFGAGPQPKRSVGIDADIISGERAVVKTVSRRHHGPNHDAAAADAEIETEPADMPNVILWRAAIGRETAPHALVRADDQTETCGCPAGENAHLRTACLLGGEWSNRT